MKARISLNNVEQKGIKAESAELEVDISMGELLTLMKEYPTMAAQLTKALVKAKLS